MQPIKIIRWRKRINITENFRYLNIDIIFKYLKLINFSSSIDYTVTYLNLLIKYFNIIIIDLFVSVNTPNCILMDKRSITPNTQIDYFKKQGEDITEEDAI